MIDHRQYERVPFYCDVVVRVLPNGVAVPARSLDLSLKGVGIVTQAAFEPDQLVTISFFLKDASQKEVQEHVLGRVAYLKADVDANRIGVEFAELLRCSQHPQLWNKLLKI